MGVFARVRIAVKNRWNIRRAAAAGADAWIWALTAPSTGTAYQSGAVPATNRGADFC